MAEYIFEKLKEYLREKKMFSGECVECGRNGQLDNDQLCNQCTVREIDDQENLKQLEVAEGDRATEGDVMEMDVTE